MNKKELKELLKMADKEIVEWCKFKAKILRELEAKKKVTKKTSR